MVALGWIRSDADRWGVYVKNRLREIQALTARESWGHCPGYENPADLPSRGVSASRLSGDLWLHGPKWLVEDEPDWPLEKIRQPEPPECRLEERKRALPAISRAERMDHQLLDPAEYSTLARLQRVTAWIFRWIHNCQNKNKRRGPLTAEEFNDA